jgi:hypothetical protein
MSSIVLHHTGTKLPSHFFDCVKKIRSYSSIPIHLITDDLNDYGLNIKIHDIKKYYELNWLNNLEYFSNDNLKEMWRGSCFRLFYIEKLIQEENLNNVLHFDNDVLLFETPEKIIEKFFNYEKFAITHHNDDEVVMGMSFIKNDNSLKEINEFIKNELNMNSFILSTKYNGFPNEMRLLSKSKLCDFISGDY